MFKEPHVKNDQYANTGKFDERNKAKKKKGNL